jgi:hypothetical protein
MQLSPIMSLYGRASPTVVMKPSALRSRRWFHSGSPGVVPMWPLKLRTSPTTVTVLSMLLSRCGASSQA